MNLSDKVCQNYYFNAFNKHKSVINLYSEDDAVLSNI